MSGENETGKPETPEESQDRADLAEALLEEKRLHDEKAKQEVAQGLDTPDGRLIERYGLPEDKDGSAAIQRIQDEIDGTSPLERLSDRQPKA